MGVAGITQQSMSAPSLPPPPATGGPASNFAPAAGPTAYLQVEGMVTAEVLGDDEEYAEVRLAICCPFKTKFRTQLAEARHRRPRYVQLLAADISGSELLPGALVMDGKGSCPQCIFEAAIAIGGWIWPMLLAAALFGVSQGQLPNVSICRA